MITGILLNTIYQNIQNGFLRQKDDLLFIHSTYTNAIFAVGLLIVFFILWFRFYLAENSFRFYSLKIKYLVLAVAVFCLTNIFAVTDMFSYSVIREEGLYVRENILSKTEFLGWDKVENVSVKYNYGTGKHKNKVYFHYYINIYDDSKIDLRYSEEFRKWEKVIFIDDYLKSKGINFKRYTIDNDIYIKLIMEYNNEFNGNADKVFKKIFFFEK